MIVNHSNLAILNQAFSAAFQSGIEQATPMWAQLASMVPSTTSSTGYGWLGNMTQFREWVGERHYQRLKAHDYTIKNKTFENTVTVGREEIEDDQYGVYKLPMQQLGQDAAVHPDELVFDLFNAGFTTPCYDGQYFFDTDHPVGMTGRQKSVSNFQGGTGTPWFLLDTSKVLKPVIYQKRRDYAFTAKTSLSDDNVFKRNEFVWGADGRGNAGFGFWQLAFASKEDLTLDAYSDARAQQQSFQGDNGKPLRISSRELWVPPSLERQALEVTKAERLANGASNVMSGTAKVVVCPWLAQ